MHYLDYGFNQILGKDSQLI